MVKFLSYRPDKLNRRKALCFQRSHDAIDQKEFQTHSNRISRANMQLRFALLVLLPLIAAARSPDVMLKVAEEMAQGRSAIIMQQDNRILQHGE